jgi:hypothetical protein
MRRYGPPLPVSCGFGLRHQLSGRPPLILVPIVTRGHIDAAVKGLEAKGMIVSDEVKARISPLESAHITFHGRYSFRRPELAGTLRPLPDPKAAGE